MSVLTGYGTDTWCGDGIVAGRMSRGVVHVALALYRRLRTPRGELMGGEEEAVYGLDLEGIIGAVGYDSAVDVLPSMVRAELLKDDRVTDVSVSATKVTDTAGLMSITLTVDVVLTDAGDTFRLTLAVSDVTTKLLGIVT
jgi:hypothetical protein